MFMVFKHLAPVGKIKRAVKKSRSPFLLCFLLPNTRQSVRTHQAPTPDSFRHPLTFGRAQGHRPTVLYSHLNFHLASCDAICCQQAFPLTLPNHSKKPWQQGHPKNPPIKPSRTARKAVSQPTSLLQFPSQANACHPVTKAICAVQSTPRRLRAAFLASFFWLLKKRKSPHAVGTGVANASKAKNDAVGPNA